MNFVDDTHLDQLFELAMYIVDDVDELKKWQENIKDELKNDWIDEPDERDLIAMQIRSS